MVLDQFQRFIKFEQKIKTTVKNLTPHILFLAKRMGVPDFLLAYWFNKKRKRYSKAALEKSYYSFFLSGGYLCRGSLLLKHLITTPLIGVKYVNGKRFKKDKSKVVILGSGPNRIGQGIEFDYSCVRSVKQLKKMGYHTVMINSNPETVSTDYDTSDQLFFEPLTTEHTLEVLNFIQPMGFFAQMGGQTPISLASSLVREGFFSYWLLYEKYRPCRGQSSFCLSLFPVGI